MCRPHRTRIPFSVPMLILKLRKSFSVFLTDRDLYERQCGEVGEPGFPRKEASSELGSSTGYYQSLASLALVAYMSPAAAPQPPAAFLPAGGFRSPCSSRPLLGHLEVVGNKAVRGSDKDAECRCPKKRNEMLQRSWTVIQNAYR